LAIFEEVIHWISSGNPLDQSVKKPTFATQPLPRFSMDDEHNERVRRLAEVLALIESRANGVQTYEPGPVDVGAIRKRIGMTQKQFAARFGFPLATLRHWERGDRKPRGSARVLLNVIARNPKAVLLATTLPLICGVQRP
jgi:putative transcriptional regulator